MASYSTSAIIAVLVAVSFVTTASTFSIYDSTRRYVRPIRSSWQTAPSEAYYYNPYPYVAAAAPVSSGTSDYDDEEEDQEDSQDGGMYSKVVSYYPPPQYLYGRSLDPVDDLQMAIRNEERDEVAGMPSQYLWYKRQQAAAAAKEKQRQQEMAAVNDAFMQNLLLADIYRNRRDYIEEEKQLKSLVNVKRSPLPSVAATMKPFVGQKEVPMLRPPSPTRNHPATPQQGVEVTSGTVDDKATVEHPPSVYDTIKQLLSIENQQDAAKPSEHHDATKGEHEQVSRSRPAPSTTSNSQEQEVHRQHKRFVSNEESLVRQLSNLKNKLSA